MNILTIIGARPQFIKAATISRVVQKTKAVKEVIVHTGQHYDENMSEVFFYELDIPKPDINLNIGSGQHGLQTGKMLEKIEEVLLIEKPDTVLVYGDTNSTLAGSLAASKLHIPIAHVEAGLRSFNKKMPEEINRILTDHVSDLLFAPTAAAVENLKKEGIDSSKVFQSGDVMFDAALFYSKKASEKSTIIEDLDLQKNQYILATIHRAENTDDPQRLRSIFEALSRVTKYNQVVIPLHPRTKKHLDDIGFDLGKSSIRFIEPVGYLDMVNLEKSAKLIITDSGGVQKEAYFHQKICITLRPETEWIELVDSGANFLVTEMSDLEDIVVSKVFPGNIGSLYGDGHSAEKILNHILHM